MARLWRQLGLVPLYMEVAMGLVVAQVLIWLVPPKVWRGSLGSVICDNSVPAQTLSEATRKRGRRVARAVMRVSILSPIPFVCLPKSIAMQWMLRRRRIPSTLVYGVSVELDEMGQRPLHAWVEIEGIEIPAGDSRLRYACNLQLQTSF